VASVVIAAPREASRVNKGFSNVFPKNLRRAKASANHFHRLMELNLLKVANLT
jgi:hypothetical protein